RDIDDAGAPSVGKEADGADLPVTRLLKVGRDLGAVIPDPGRRDAGLDRKLEPGHVEQQLADLAGFPRKLGVVGEVLVLAPTAGAEERAARFDPFGRCLEHLDEIGLGAVFVVAEYPGLHPLPRQAEWDKHDPSTDAPDAHAKVAERFDGELDLLMIGERIRVEFLRRTLHGKIGYRGAVAQS